MVKPPGSGIFSSRGRPLSIVCAEAFHCRVRDENGWVRLALTTRRRLANSAFLYQVRLAFLASAGYLLHFTIIVKVYAISLIALTYLHQVRGQGEGKSAKQFYFSISGVKNKRGFLAPYPLPFTKSPREGSQVEDSSRG